jgi:hypothetical protein
MLMSKTIIWQNELRLKAGEPLSDSRDEQYVFRETTSQVVT